MGGVVGGSVEQLINEGGAFVRLFGRDEALGFFDGGDDSDDVEVGAAKECDVIGQGRLFRVRPALFHFSAMK